MNPGDVFNPWFGECGFYPGDIVCKQSSKTLSQGQKLLYTRLVRYAGRDGRCFPSQERLATDLGISERQVRKDLIRIEAFRLIDRQAREGRRGDTYTFLWHPMFDVFDRNYSSAQTGGNEDLTGTPVPLKPGIGGPRPEPNEDLTGTKGSFDRNCGSAYPIKKPSEKSSSSFPSSSESGPEDDDELFSSGGKTQTHSPEDRQRFGKFMRGMIEPSPAEDPRDKLVAEILTRAPGWSVDEAIEALKVNCVESQSAPKFYRWFLKVLEDVYQKRNGVSPKPGTTRKARNTGGVPMWQGFGPHEDDENLNEEGYPRVMM